MLAANGILTGIGLLAGVVIGPRALLLLSLLLILNLVQRRPPWTGALLLAVSVLIGAARTHVVPDALEIEDLAKSTAATGRVQSLPVAGGSGERTVVSVERIQFSDETWTDVSGRVLVYLPETGPGAGVGDTLFLVWQATPLERLSPGYAGFVASQGAIGSANVWFYAIEERGHSWLGSISNVRRRIGHQLQHAIPGDAGALATGIVTGDDSALSEETESAFLLTGTRHVTAVSGQNVGLLIGFLALALRPGRRSTLALTHGVMLLLVWFYVVMVGLEPPALRAAIVATVMMLSVWFGRRADPLTILALTLGGMALLDPGMVKSVGFWLSASASWALCSAMTTTGFGGFAGAVVATARGVMAANIATLPILLWTFGVWSPISLLANLLIGPIMTAIFPLTYILAVLAFTAPPLVPLLSWIPAIGLDFALVIVQRMANVVPVIHLPVTSPAMALVIAIPCFGALALLSRDGNRWQRIAGLEWQSRRAASLALTVGLVIGGVAGLVVTSFSFPWG